MHSHTDEQLMEGFRCSGNSRCIDVLMSRYGGRALGAALMFTRDRADAQDAVQDTFVSIVRRGNQYQPGMPFAPWFFRILRNACLDLLRRRKAYSRALSNIEIPTDIPPDTSDRASRVRALMEQLPEKDRRILVLRINAGLQLSEIAAACGCSEEAAKKRAQRALQSLRRLIDESECGTDRGSSGERSPETQLLACAE